MYAWFQNRMLNDVPELYRSDGVHGLFNKTNVYLSKSSIAKMPTFEFHLANNLTLTLPPALYLRYRAAPGVEEPILLTSLLIMHSERSYITFGQTLLNGLYLEFDRAKKTLGVAMAHKGCMPQEEVVSEPST